MKTNPANRPAPPPQTAKAFSSQHGFSLLEVVIALAVLALAMSALIDSSSSATRNTVHLQDKTFAHWVAMNRMAEMQLENTWPEVGETSGEMEMAARKWKWRATVTATQEKFLRRVDIRVRKPEDPDDTSVTLLTGYLSKQSPGNPATNQAPDNPAPADQEAAQ